MPVELVGAPVERQHLLAFLGAADSEVALHLRGVEDVERTAAVEGDVVGDVDQRIDRAEADGQQPPLHPVRRRAVLDAAHEAQREGRAELLVVALRSRASRRPGTGPCPHRRHAIGLQRAEARGREIAGDAMDRGAVGPVRREVDLDHRIVEAGIGRVGHADRRIPAGR